MILFKCFYFNNTYFVCEPLHYNDKETKTKKQIEEIVDTTNCVDSDTNTKFKKLRQIQ